MCEDLVTIVIPAYNAELFLRENIESIINQSYKNLEIIYICDGCTDHTFEILQEYAERDSRITIVNKQENHGAAICRNMGMDIASGEWITFWDSDDLFHKNAIESMLKTALKEHADIVGCYWEDFDDVPSGQASVENGMRKLYCNTYPIIHTKKEMYHILQLIDNSPYTKLVHKSIYMKKEVFFQDIPNSNDVYYAMVSAINSHKIVYVDFPFVYYRSDKGRVTISTNRNLKRAYILEACDKVYDYIKNHYESSLLLRSFYNAVFENIRCYINYPTYDELSDLLKSVYMQKWKMHEHNVMRELSYINRIFYKNMMNKNMIIDNQNVNMQAKVEFVRTLAHSNCSIWGVGAQGRQLLKNIFDAGIELQHVFDSSKKKWGEKVQGYTIENFDKVKADHIIVTTHEFYDEIAKSVARRVEHIYDLELQIYLIPCQYELWNETY